MVRTYYPKKEKTETENYLAETQYRSIDSNSKNVAMDKSSITAGGISAAPTPGGISTAPPPGDIKSAATSTTTTTKPVVRGKGKALNAIAAASGRDPEAIVAAAAAARARMDEEEAAEAAAKREKEMKEVRVKNIADNAALAGGENGDDDDDEEIDQTPSLMYNQLSEQDRYRFECFRRCGFPSLQMEHFIAKMLVEEAEKRFVMRGGVKVGIEQDSTILFASSIITPDDAFTPRSDENNKYGSVKDSAQLKRKKKQSMKRILNEDSKRRRVAMDQPFPYHHQTSGYSSFSGLDGQKNAPTPKLEHLVVPSSASEIVAVVSTLAKCYAQRLVAAARRIADAEIEKEKEMDKNEKETKNVTSTSTIFPTTEALPLQPHHLLDAHMYRVRAGLDPGFWMSSRIGQQQGLGVNKIKSVVGVIEAAALGSFDRDQACYLAALAAQDAYASEVADNSESAMRGDTVEDCEINIEEMKE